jgi:hypothetical protein
MAKNGGDGPKRTIDRLITTHRAWRTHGCAEPSMERAHGARRMGGYSGVPRSATSPFDGLRPSASSRRGTASLARGRKPCAAARHGELHTVRTVRSSRLRVRPSSERSPISHGRRP